MFYDRFLLGISDNANIVLKWDVMYINNFKIEYKENKHYNLKLEYCVHKQP